MRLLLPLLLCACKALSGESEIHLGGGATPIVRAADGGSALVSITVCPRTLEGIVILKEFIDEMINYPSELAIARGGGSARLVLNFCPGTQSVTPLSRGK